MMLSDTLQKILRSRLEQDTPALLYGDRSWTWREHLAEATTLANGIIRTVEPVTEGERLHVGTLLGNTPDMARALAAAGLGGFVLCCINDTRRGAGLASDVRRSNCALLLTDAEHRPLLDGLDLGDTRVIEVGTDEHAALLARGEGELQPLKEIDPFDTFALVFTSGTSGDPKAVQMNSFMLIMGPSMLVERFGLTPADVCYVSMPMFHSNGLMAGWAVALSAGAAMAVATFSASRFLADVRHYGATYMNYVGTPLAYILATPEQPDDADTPLRAAFGNEARDRDIEEFGRRFGCEVYDAFGSTEGAIIITRVDGTPRGSIGQPYEGVAVYNSETIEECPRAEFDDNGALLNPDEAIGELVNTQGAGWFRGYYNNEAADAERMRHGMYWSGDLAYRDADGFVYLAGRTADWMRVQGENLAAAPIERVLMRLPALNRVAVYAVRGEQVGDEVMAAMVLNDGASLTPEELEDFLAQQPDLSPKAWPRYVRLEDELPITATNKILKRQLVSEGARTEGGRLWMREERGTTYAVC